MGLDRETPVTKFDPNVDGPQDAEAIAERKALRAAVKFETNVLTGISVLAFVGMALVTVPVAAVIMQRKCPSNNDKSKCPEVTCSDGRCVADLYQCFETECLGYFCVHREAHEFGRTTDQLTDTPMPTTELTTVNSTLQAAACDSNPCRSGGTCMERTNRYTCSCARGYSGYNCQYSCDRYHGTSCYTLVRELMTWQAASDFCSASSGHLIALESEAEENAILSSYTALDDYDKFEASYCEGNDLGVYALVHSALKCVEYCSNLPGCMAVEFQSGQERCWPKTACPNPMYAAYLSGNFVYRHKSQDVFFRCWDGLLAHLWDSGDRQFLNSSGSYQDEVAGDYQSLLDTPTTTNLRGGWSAELGNSDIWMMLDLQGLTVVHGIITQGRHDGADWITHYSLRYYRDTDAYLTITAPDGSFTFVGNSDGNTKVQHLFKENILASRIQLIATAWMGRPTLRWEILGCRPFRGQAVLTHESSHQNNAPANQGFDGLANQWSASACFVSGAESQPWWTVTLGELRKIHGVIMLGLLDFDGEPMTDVYFWLLQQGSSPLTDTDRRLCKHVETVLNVGPNGVLVPCDSPAVGRALSIQMGSSVTDQVLRFCEVLLLHEGVSCEVAGGTPAFSTSTNDIHNVLSASSYLDAASQPGYGLLKTEPSPENNGAWVAASSDMNQWVQADLSEIRAVYKIATQGSSFGWIKTYMIITSQDGIEFEVSRTNEGLLVMYQGNSDSYTVMETVFSPPLYTRILRLQPVRWEPTDGLQISLRWELYVCPTGRWTDGIPSAGNHEQWAWQHDDAALTYTSWDPAAHLSTHHDACLITRYPDGRAQWLDADCGDVGFPVCEYEAEIVDECRGQPCENGGTCIDEELGYRCICAEGYQGTQCNIHCVGDSCYTMVYVPGSRAEASVYCTSIEGHIVDIEDSVENEIVRQLVLTIGSSIWTDGLRVNHETVWPSNRRTLSYSNWRIGQPDSSAAECIEMYLDGQWGDVSCGALRPYICETPYVEWVEWGVYQYHVSQLHNRTWDGVVTECSRRQATPVGITSDAENSFLQQLIRSNSAEHFWVGLRQGSEVCTCEGSTSRACTLCRESWRWSDGTAMQYQRWLPSFPTGFGCGYMTKTGWETTRCSTKYKYICKKCLSSDGLCALGANNPQAWHTGVRAQPESAHPEWAVDADDGTCTLTMMEARPWWFASVPVDVVLRQVVLKGNLPMSDLNPVSVGLSYTNPSTGNMHTDIQGNIERSWCSSPNQALISGSDYSIEDRYIRASTQLNQHAGSDRARLDLEGDTAGNAGGWCPTVRDIMDPWIQADLRLEFFVDTIVTQGRSDNEQWVETYIVSYSLDGSTWSQVLDTDGSVKVFQANFDLDTHVQNRLPETVLTRFIRLHPKTWTWNGPCMRFDIYGCEKMTYSVTFEDVVTSQAEKHLVVQESAGSLASQLRVCEVQFFSQAATDIDVCASNPCQNDGICQDALNSFTCACPQGVTGDTCQYRMDECESDPCENRAACSSTEGGGYTCACPAGLFGPNCQYHCSFIWGGSCYHLLSETSSWRVAKAECEDMGARLVSIESSEENDALAAVLPLAQPEFIKIWTGGVLLHFNFAGDEDAYYMWEPTGERLSYAIFPFFNQFVLGLLIDHGFDSGFGAFFCVYMMGGMWHLSVRCDAELMALCEYP